jgi:hypothetical protein
MPFVMLKSCWLEVFYPNLVVIHVESYYRIINLHDVVAISKNP